MRLANIILIAVLVVGVVVMLAILTCMARKSHARCEDACLPRHYTFIGATCYCKTDRGWDRSEGETGP